MPGPLRSCHSALQAYIKTVELLIDLASLQTAFLTLDQAIKTTNRRVNALDNVVRPRLENTIAYIKVRSLPCTWAICALGRVQRCRGPDAAGRGFTELGMPTVGLAG